MLQLADSHVHLDDDHFDADRSAVLQRARAAGVIAQIIPAITVASWSRIDALCKEHADLYPAYGLHPMFLDQHRPDHLDVLERWLNTHRAVALGEIGLDYFMPGLDVELQRLYFQRQLELARDLRLPVIVHARRAVDEVTMRLRKVGQLSGVVHSFAGSEQQAQQLWKLGFHLGIGGPVTYLRAQRLRRIVATMPIQYLLLETDAPDQPDAQHRGQRNEPARVSDILDCVAQLRGESREAVAKATTDNVHRLFGLP